MRKFVAASAAMHLVIGVFAYFGLPHLADDEPVDAVLVVDVVNIDDITNLPSLPKPKQTEKAPEPKEEAKKEEPKPEPPQAKPEPAPPPPPPPQPQQDVVALPPPETKPEPKAKEKPKPEPEPEAKPKAPKVPDALKQVKPKKKPAPPDPFASVLKTVADLKKEAPPERKEAEKKEPSPKDDFEKKLAETLAASRSDFFDTRQPLSLSIIDAVRNQIRQCWLVPAGAKGVEEMDVPIRVWMDPNGVPRQAKILEQRRMSDSFYRAVAESALRAVLNPRCHPFKLPRDKYDQWQTITLNFDPRDMF